MYCMYIRTGPQPLREASTVLIPHTNTAGAVQLLPDRQQDSLSPVMDPLSSCNQFSAHCLEWSQVMWGSENSWTSAVNLSHFNISLLQLYLGAIRIQGWPTHKLPSRLGKVPAGSMQKMLYIGPIK